MYLVPRRLVTVATIASLSFLAFGLNAEGRDGSVAGITYFGFTPPADQAAREGLAAIYAGDDFNYGLPLPLYRKGFKGWDSDRFWQALGSLPSPPNRDTGGFPLQVSDSLFERDGVAAVNINCFACHSGVVAGQVVAGLGSTHIDTVSFRENARALIEKWDSPLQHVFLGLILGHRGMEILRGFIDHQRDIVIPSMQAVARGEDFGPWVVWRHIARMTDPAAGLTTSPPGTPAPLASLLDRPLPPVSPNPWWNLRYKTRDFWTRDVTLASLPTFALNLMDPSETQDNDATFPARMDRTGLMLAFAAQTVAPPYPHRDAVDAGLAQRGWALFHGEEPIATGARLACASCHGSYDASGALAQYQSEAVVPLAVVGTDPEYTTILHGELKPLYDHFARSKYIPAGTTNAVYPQTLGYIAPPLAGLWAIAPYFHNGSVPTVYGVLNSAARPLLWQKNLDPMAYDDHRLGHAAVSVSPAAYQALQAQAQASGDPMSAESLAARLVFDCRGYGRSNQGHPFGDAMTDDERFAVIEFLKLL